MRARTAADRHQCSIHALSACREGVGQCSFQATFLSEKDDCFHTSTKRPIEYRCFCYRKVALEEPLGQGKEAGMCMLLQNGRGKGDKVNIKQRKEEQRIIM